MNIEVTMSFLNKFFTRDAVRNSNFILAFLWFFSASLLICIFAGGPFLAFLIKGGIFLVILAAAILSALVVSGADKAGGIFTIMTGQRGRSIRTLREQLSGELTLGREEKKRGEYKEALLRMDAYLEQDPDFSEALLLKAQVLWEGLGLAEEARQVLLKIINTASKDDPAHAWARQIYQEIRRSQII